MENDGSTFCDTCGLDTKAAWDGQHHGLEALWGYRICADGQHCRVHLCESCFIQVLGFNARLVKCS